MKRGCIEKVELVWPGKYDENGNLMGFDIPKIPYSALYSHHEIFPSRKNKDSGMPKTL